MKTRKTFEHEYQRYNVTPAQFLAYLRSMAKKYPGELCNDFDLAVFKGESWSTEYHDALPSEKPCASEICTDHPYEKQTYIRNFDGTTYNEIIEFQFSDETHGTGYYYTVQIDVDEADKEANTRETIADIIERRTKKADREEAKAAKIEAEADEAEKRGYTGKWWIEMKRSEAAHIMGEVKEARAAIAEATAALEAVEAPQTAENDSTTDNTTPVMKAAEKAHQSRYSARQTAPLTFAIWDNVKNAPIIETTSNGIMAYMEIFGIDRIEPAPAETIPTTEAEPAPISEDERRAALDRLNHAQNAANLFTNISPADVDSAVMMDRANATTTATAYSRPAYDWTQDNDTTTAASGAGTPRTAQAG